MSRPLRTAGASLYQQRHRLERKTRAASVLTRRKNLRTRSSTSLQQAQYDLETKITSAWSTSQLRWSSDLTALILKFWQGKRGEIRSAIGSWDRSLSNSSQTDDALTTHLEILMLLDIKAVFDYRDQWGRSVLHRAARSGRPGCIKRLVEFKHFDDNIDLIQDVDWHTALHCATQAPLPTTPLGQSGGSDCARLLLGAGSNVNATNKCFKTPLHLAVTRGNAKTVRVLLSAKANIDSVDGFGKTALNLAAGKGRVECLTLLLRAGANHRITDEHGYTPLAQARFFRKRRCIETLERHLAAE